MGLQSLENFYRENGKKETVSLLKNKITITEKINAHRVYCRKQKNGNIIFYSKKKKIPINVLDRLLSDLFEPFIEHLISKKKNLEIGEYGFYFFNKPVDIEYGKKPINNILLTNIPEQSNKTALEVAIDLEVSYHLPLFQGVLNNSQIKKIINYIQHNENIISVFNSVFDKKCSEFVISDNDIIEGFVFNIDDVGFFKLNDNRFVKKDYPKLDTSAYELLVIEIFDFIKDQDFYNIRFTTKNEQMKRAEFTFEVFNRFVEKYSEKNILNNFLLIPPPFIKTKGNLNKKYICNKKTINLLTDEKMEYLLRIFITIIKGKQSPRGIISETIADDINITILKITDYIKKSNELLDYKEFKKFN